MVYACCVGAIKLSLLRDRERILLTSKKMSTGKRVAVVSWIFLHFNVHWLHVHVQLCFSRGSYWPSVKYADDLKKKKTKKKKQHNFQHWIFGNMNTINIKGNFEHCTFIAENRNFWRKIFIFSTWFCSFTKFMNLIDNGTGPFPADAKLENGLVFQ